MSQNINSMLGGMPDDIEKGGIICCLNIIFIAISIIIINDNIKIMLGTKRPRNDNHENFKL